MKTTYLIMSELSEKATSVLVWGTNLLARTVDSEPFIILGVRKSDGKKAMALRLGNYPPPWSYYKIQGMGDRYVVRDSRRCDLLETWDEELADALCNLANSITMVRDIDISQVVVVKQATGLMPLHHVLGNPQTS